MISARTSIREDSRSLLMIGVLNICISSSPDYQAEKAKAAVKIARRIIKHHKLGGGEDLWYALLHWRNTPNSKGYHILCIPSSIETLNQKLITITVT